MTKLEKALELRKAKYIRRTGSPGKYRYVYTEKGQRVTKKTPSVHLRSESLSSRDSAKDSKNFKLVQASVAKAKQIFASKQSDVEKEEKLYDVLAAGSHAYNQLPTGGELAKKKLPLLKELQKLDDKHLALGVKLQELADAEEDA